MHWFTSVNIFVMLVVFFTWVAARDHQLFTPVTVAAEDLPWFAAIHGQVYRYAWLLVVASIAWSAYLARNRDIRVLGLVIFTSVSVNVTAAWGLWTIFTLYVLANLELAMQLNQLPA